MLELCTSEATLWRGDGNILNRETKLLDRFWVINNEDEDGNIDERRCRFGEVLIFLEKFLAYIW